MTKPDKAMQSKIKGELDRSSPNGVLPTPSEPSITEENKPQGIQVNSEASAKVKEVGGPKGLEPTRYGDWESKGRCYDF